MLKRIRWYLWVLAGIFLLYLMVSIYFMEHFFLGTTVNGRNVELQTVKQVNSLILEQADGYELTLLERGGSEESMTAQQLGMSFSETENVRNYKRIQNGFLWPRMFWQQDSYQITPDITFDEVAFDEALAALSCVQDGEEPAGPCGGRGYAAGACAGRGRMLRGPCCDGGFSGDYGAYRKA